METLLLFRGQSDSLWKRRTPGAHVCGVPVNIGRLQYLRAWYGSLLQFLRPAPQLQQKGPMFSSIWGVSPSFCKFFSIAACLSACLVLVSLVPSWELAGGGRAGVVTACVLVGASVGGCLVDTARTLFFGGGSSDFGVLLWSVSFFLLLPVLERSLRVDEVTERDP